MSGTNFDWTNREIRPLVETRVSLSAEVNWVGSKPWVGSGRGATNLGRVAQ